MDLIQNESSPNNGRVVLGKNNLLQLPLRKHASIHPSLCSDLSPKGRGNAVANFVHRAKPEEMSIGLAHAGERYRSYPQKGQYY